MCLKDFFFYFTSRGGKMFLDIFELSIANRKKVLETIFYSCGFRFMKNGLTWPTNDVKKTLSIFRIDLFFCCCFFLFFFFK